MLHRKESTRLRRGPVDLLVHVVPLRVGVDAELNRFAGFGRIVFFFRFHGCLDRGFHTRLTTPCHHSASVRTIRIEDLNLPNPSGPLRPPRHRFLPNPVRHPQPNHPFSNHIAPYRPPNALLQSTTPITLRYQPSALQPPPLHHSITPSLQARSAPPPRPSQNPFLPFEPILQITHSASGDYSGKMKCLAVMPDRWSYGGAPIER